MAQKRGFKAYLVKWGHNQYRVIRWNIGYAMKTESASMPYFVARAIVAAANCPGGEKCHHADHHGTP